MLLISYGTRPEYIKVKPIIEQLTVPVKVLFTGQHLDIAPQTDCIHLGICEGDNRLDSIVSSVLNHSEVFTDVTYVLVQGDTTSAFAVALAAFHRQIKVIHLEAGLRTWDKNNPYPEETNRQMISAIADIHLCPTHLNAENLAHYSNVYVLGNTGLDNIDNSNIEYGDEIIITLHRRENHHRIADWFTVLNQLAQSYPSLTFTIPLHPNPNIQKSKYLLTNLNVIQPLPHEQMVERVKKCKLVISDSGGLQEECSFLKKKIIVCRQTTERPETININSYLCPRPELLMDVFKQVVLSPIPEDNTCPYGDGYSSYRVSKLINKLIKGV